MLNNPLAIVSIITHSVVVKQKRWETQVTRPLVMKVEKKKKYWWLRNCGIRTYWTGLRRSSRPPLHWLRTQERSLMRVITHIQLPTYVTHGTSNYKGGEKVKLSGALESVWWDKKPAVDFVMEMSWCRQVRSDIANITHVQPWNCCSRRAIAYMV